jgi:hypothetical protein
MKHSIFLDWWNHGGCPALVSQLKIHSGAIHDRQDVREDAAIGRTFAATSMSALLIIETQKMWDES